MFCFTWAIALGLLVSGSFQASVKIDPATLPTFLTPSQDFKVTEKDTVTLPCKVSNPGPYVLAWKKGIAVLSAGNVKVSPDPRINLLSDYSLEIKEIEIKDAGDYVCQIGTLEPREITHSVEILIPPFINYVTNNGKVEIRKDQAVQLECRASGNPEPKITWSRKNNLLPNGEQTTTTNLLNLGRVDRHHAGVYQCVASNGVGEDVSREIVLHVLYPPEIFVENPVVHTGEGQEAELVCTVYGENPPEVHWYRDTMVLDTTERRIMETRGSKHKMVIRLVKRTDFGNYTCVADNQLGKTRKSVQLTGLPKSAEFNSATQSTWKDMYNISWSVKSFSPIEEYKLYYRPIPNGGLPSEDGHPQPLHHSSKRLIPGRENKTYATVTYGMGHRRSDWRDVIIIADRGLGNVQSGSHLLKDLTAGQNYEAKVIARNKFGWGPTSGTFTFQTLDADSIFVDRPQLPRYIFNENEMKKGVGITLMSSPAGISTFSFALYIIINALVILT